MATVRRTLVRQLSASAALTAIAMGFAALLWVWLRGQTMVFQGSIAFVITLCATISVSVLAILAVTVRVVRRCHAVVQWMVFLPMLAIAGALGTALAALAVSVFGAHATASIGIVFAENVRGTVASTVTLGALFLVIERYASRLRAAEAQVQAHEIERERAVRLASEAQLASLSARLQPHFLFNTLTAIAELVRDDPRLAEDTIERLSGVLRSSLDTALLVPFERETRLVDDYLQLQRVRLGDRLRFSIDWDPDGVRGATLPPFAVQTLVENAVKHVAGQRASGVSIVVRARQVDHHLLVDVTDDGSGFDAAVLRAAHGLDMLQARLRAIYGGHAHLDFVRESAAMTVRLRIPLESGVPLSATADAVRHTAADSPCVRVDGRGKVQDASVPRRR